MPGRDQWKRIQGFHEWQLRHARVPPGARAFHQDAGGNNYVGTYTGSKTGPAKLAGTLQGDRLVMTIKWGGLVNGDRTAQMVLERTGPDSFAQIVNDTVEGKKRSTSNFAFVRR